MEKMSKLRWRAHWGGGEIEGSGRMGRIQEEEVNGRRTG